MVATRTSLALCALVVVVCLGQALGYGVELYGVGTPNAISVLKIWTPAYLFTRDDISITYGGVGITPAISTYTQGDADFLVMDRGLPADLSAQYGGLAQMPLAGQAQVIVYNISALNSTDPNIVVDRETLGLIWAGNITKWNDTRIKALNPAIANKLPGADILIGYNENSAISLPEVFKIALERFSEDFAIALAAANRTWALMPPAQRGTAVAAGGSTVARLAWLQANDNSLTFLNYADTTSSNFKWMNMINKAGKLVTPSVASVQAAMADYSEYYGQGNFTIDIVDAPGNYSWPISYVNYLSVKQNITTFDCTNFEELLAFVAWIQTNDAASQRASEINVAPMAIPLRETLLDLLRNVRCNGEQVYTTAYLTGFGAPLAVFTSWAAAWSNLEFRMKYYQGTSADSRKRVPTREVDFGVVSDGSTGGATDIVLTPAIIYSIVPAYNIPELKGKSLVLNFDVIARIYLGEITSWNDSRIRDLNSADVAAVLPNKPIVVVVQTVASALTQVFTTVLDQTVPDWSVVGAGPLVTFPVQNIAPNRTIGIAGVDLLTPLQANSYSFAWWLGYEVFQARKMAAAALQVSSGSIISADATSIISALTDYEASGDTSYANLLLGASASSWPVATFGSMIYPLTGMRDCDEAAALAEFLYWSQTDPNAVEIATRQGFVLATVVPSIKSRLLNQLKRFTCDGVQVSQLANCILDGQLCSDSGSCINNECKCDTGKEGQYCETTTSSSSDDTLVIVLASVIPSAAFLLLLLLCLFVVLLVIIRRKGRTSDDWEIEYSELEIGEQLGAGGYGEVHKATWKGTEVAVKVMASEKITKDMEKSFKDEVRVMTALRHPNVVLFMAASTKAPKMCIVMEFMALGSLYDLLHNELIPDIPHPLKAKMAYQASKGMHFLHSSGIVHRDLKSLNLLLDNKWNVKVSDFGLTKFKEDVGAKGKDIAGSVHWTAPEILNESPEVDLILADVYSFGIILWELLTREQPYLGLSPAAVAVAVIRDGIRPLMPEANSVLYPQEFGDLITSCWHADPTIRPTFLEIMTRLSAMHGDSTSAGATSTNSSSSSGHSGGGVKKDIYGSWTMPSTTNSTGTSNTSSNSSNSSKNLSATQAAAAAGAVRAPEGEVAIVFTDITRAASLWEFNAAAMRDATLLHNETLRAALKRHRGYEVVFIRDRNSGEGSFCMAFQQASDALAWCSDVQQALLAVEWPEALLDHPGAAEEWGDTDDRVVYKGLRVRMGVHMGVPRVVRDPMTRRVEYIGPVVNAAARITAMTHGGQIVMSHAVHDKIKDSDLVKGDNHRRLVGLGKFEMPDSPQGAKLYELKVVGLEGRFFGGVTHHADSDHPTSGSAERPTDTSGELAEMNLSSGPSGHRGKNKYGNAVGSGGGGDDDGELQTAVGEGMMFKEDTFLTSANLCRWIIDFHEIQVGKQVGLGSYGVVYRGKWKGVEVAVKRFIKQKLDERRMLEFRAEMAFLSELHHPNIVLFIGACVKKPNLCIVTEFMKQGSLKDILANNAIKLAWKQKLRLLRSAALGINYLHSLHPVIVHRDLKPSNLLVDENMNVKVADFGFARIKEENATMTRCGTPCWTAPEVLRGEKYDERADVFSFGIIMWQVATRKEPYAGRNFMGVSLDVLEGKRPQIPNDCPPEFKKVMKKCWHASADKRPTLEDVVAFLDQQVGDDNDSSAAQLGL